jgi:hypothetical protein
MPKATGDGHPIGISKFAACVSNTPNFIPFFEIGEKILSTFRHKGARL